MKNQKGELKVTKPVSAWNKPLNAQYRSLFSAITKGIVNGALLKWESVPGNIADGLVAIGLETTPEQKAWVLIRKALTYSICSLIGESLDFIEPEKIVNADQFVKTIDITLENQKVTIDISLFERPDELSLLDDIIPAFNKWLFAFGLDSSQAQAVANRLKPYFVRELHLEWQRNPSDYTSIKEVVYTPFTQADSRQRAWMSYNAYLEKAVNESIFGETFSLTDIYIKPNAFYEQTKKKEEEKDLDAGHKKLSQKVVIKLEDELNNWLKDFNKDDPIRIITGGPGCGKSSFVKMYAADIAASGDVPVLFIPLHLLNVTSSLVSAVSDYVLTSGIVTFNPLDNKEGESRLLIIFDGLDELSMMGRLGAEAAKEFVSGVIDTVNTRNSQKTHLMAIIAGRPVVVDANKSRFRKPEQILEILPYYTPKNEHKSQEYIDNDGLIEKDQRQDWWIKYGEIKGLGYDGMPLELKRKELEAITKEPLLNYLVSLSYSRKKIDFSKDINLNSVYYDLFEAVYERGWGDSQHKVLKEMNQEDFLSVLEEVSLACWHGNGRTVTVGEIEQYCTKARKQKLLEPFKQGAKADMTGLLASFYFRQSSVVRDHALQTFEFTHKSFREYLTARRIINGTLLLCEELDRSQQRLGGWDEEKSLEYWIKLCGSTRMDMDLLYFVRNQVKLLPEEKGYDLEKMEKIQKQLCSLFSFFLKCGLPMQSARPDLIFAQQTEHARNAEETLMTVLNAFALVTKNRSEIDWASWVGAGNWLHKIAGQRTGPGNVIAYDCMSYVCLDKQVLHIHDLYRINLSFSSLVESELVFGVLISSLLQGANLERAQLECAQLKWANLQEANLQEANLQGANLQGANLQEANLQEANLQGANLQEAQLQGAKLQGAQLKGANLKGAQLQGANLQGTHLKGAKLQGAKLKGAKLQGAHLERAKLERAKLQGAKLQGAKLQGQ